MAHLGHKGLKVYSMCRAGAILKSLPHCVIEVSSVSRQANILLCFFLMMCIFLLLGVTTTTPTKLNFPNTMTDLDHDTWMLSGSSVLQDGVTIQNGYACDLDKLMEGQRLGIMRKSDGTVHFFINGEDCGVAASSVPPGKLAVQKTSFSFYSLIYLYFF
jgi:hypothetical protein